MTHVSFFPTSTTVLSRVFYFFSPPNLTPPYSASHPHVSMATTSPLCTLSFPSASIIFAPRSYTVSISVDFRVSLPVLEAAPAIARRSIWISTTSASMTSVSSLMRTPMALRKAWVRASVFDIQHLQREELAASKHGEWGLLARPMAMAVLSVPG
jgi:hypothetical protein